MINLTVFCIIFESLSNLKKPHGSLKVLIVYIKVTHPKTVWNTFGLDVLDNLEPLVADLQGHLDGLLVLLPVDQLFDHGADVLLAPQPPRLLRPQEPDVVRRLFDVVLHIGQGLFTGHLESLGALCLIFF
jgi:hypothetical protein